MMKKRGVVHAIVVASILACSCIPFRSIVQQPSTQITDPSDGLLGAWDLWKVQNNLVAGKDVFAGDTFYPHPQSILFSDVFITSAVLSLPLRLVVREPILLYNIVLITSQLLTVITLYALFLLCMDDDDGTEIDLSATEQLKRSLHAGAMSLLVSVCAVHLHYVGHLHVFGLQYVVMGLLCIVQWIRRGKGIWLLGFALAVILQVWQSFFLAYPMLFVAALSLLFPMLRKQARTQWTWVSGSVIFLGLGVLPLAYAYLHFFHTYHVVRDIREVIHFSMQNEDLWGKFFSPLFFATLILAAVLWMTRRSVLTTIQRLFLSAGGFFFMLCFGPTLHWAGESVKVPVAGHTLHIPLPYTIFYYLLPGFQAFRTPSRFFPITIICVCVVATVVLYRRLNTRGVALLWSMVLMWALCKSALATFTLPSTVEYPRSVSFLATQPAHVLAVLPLSNWAQVSASDDIRWMLYSLQTKSILLNGQSGFFPDEWMTFQHEVDIAPMDTKMQLFRYRGVEIVVVDTQWMHDLPHETSHVRRAFTDNRFVVYTLTP